MSSFSLASALTIRGLCSQTPDLLKCGIQQAVDGQFVLLPKCCLEERPCLFDGEAANHEFDTRKARGAVELFNLLSPIHHTSRRANLHRYKGEPYAVAADIYSQPPHVGRVGWTWYTGAAGWLYRAGLESILGFRKQGSALLIDPCIPREWKRFAITYRHGSSLYRIRVENPNGVCRGVSRVSPDGSLLSGGALLPLSDDGSEHCVEVVLG